MDAYPGLEHLRSGKVRDIYRAEGDRLLLVASDRVSTYDSVLPTPIPQITVRKSPPRSRPKST